jgi:hypothetical protein
VGEEFTISINVADNTGLSHLRLIPEYNSEVFTLKSITNGTVLSNLTTFDGYLSWSAGENSIANGTLAELTFEVNENATAGDYSIGISVVDGNGGNGEVLEAEVVNATATVMDFVYGDCNGDGKVNSLDLITLRKYITSYDHENGQPTMEIHVGADANGDGYITIDDIVAIRQYLANYDYDKEEPTVNLGRKD